MNDLTKVEVNKETFNFGELVGHDVVVSFNKYSLNTADEFSCDDCETNEDPNNVGAVMAMEVTDAETMEKLDVHDLPNPNTFTMCGTVGFTDVRYLDETDMTMKSDGITIVKTWRRLTWDAQ